MDDEGICKEQVQNFLKNELEFMVEDDQIATAHWLGKQGLKGKILASASKLKGKKNPQEPSYFIDPQLPEELAAEKREINVAGTSLFISCLTRCLV